MPCLNEKVYICHAISMSKSHHKISLHEDLESETKCIMQHLFYVKAKNIFLQHMKWFFFEVTICNKLYKIYAHNLYSKSLYTCKASQIVGITNVCSSASSRRQQRNRDMSAIRSYIRGSSYPEPVYTGWSSVQWDATGMPLVGPVYTGIPLGYPANTCSVHWNTTGKTYLKEPHTGMPLDKLSWKCPTLGCHWRNSNFCSLHWNTTGGTVTAHTRPGTYS